MPKNPFEGSGGVGPPADRSAESAEGLRADAAPPVEPGAGSSAGVKGRSLPEVPAPATTSGAADVAASSADGEAQRLVPRVTAPEKTVAPVAPSTANEGPGVTVISTPEDVERVLAERGGGTVAPSTARAQAAPRSARTRSKKVVERGDGKCRAYAPKGTKCKLCGKVHP